jgi:hypothetical protein
MLQNACKSAVDKQPINEANYKPDEAAPRRQATGWCNSWPRLCSRYKLFRLKNRHDESR